MNSVTIILGKIATYILNPVIVLGFVVATIYLFWAIIQMIWGAEEGKWDDKKKNVMYAIFGMFVMFSVYGILRLVLSTFGLCNGAGLFC
jgi:hypothetical protein